MMVIRIIIIHLDMNESIIIAVVLAAYLVSTDLMVRLCDDAKAIAMLVFTDSRISTFLLI